MTANSTYTYHYTVFNKTYIPMAHTKNTRLCSFHLKHSVHGILTGWAKAGIYESQADAINKLVEAEQQKQVANTRPVSEIPAFKSYEAAKPAAQQVAPGWIVSGIATPKI